MVAKIAFILYNVSVIFCLFIIIFKIVAVNEDLEAILEAVRKIFIKELKV